MAPAEIHSNPSFIYNFPFPVVVSVTLVVLFSVYKNCAEIYQFGIKINGVYKINPDGLGEFEVYCDQKTAGGGWTVFQKRQDGSVDFYRPWDDYKRGFGNLNGEFWLGLDKINRLTVSGSYKLRVDLEDLQGRTAFAEYSSFAVTSERTKYQLSLGSYSGRSFYHTSVCYHSPVSPHSPKNLTAQVTCSFVPSDQFALGECNDGDNNENVKKQKPRLNRQNKNSARASRFLVHFFAVVAELRWENASFHVFMEDVNKRRLNFLSLSELKYGSIIGIRLKKSSLVFDKENELE